MHVTATTTARITCAGPKKWLNQYEIVKEIGRGEFGHVKLALNTENNTYYAIKLLDRKDKPRLGRPAGEKAETKIMREIDILKRCCHQNVIRLHEYMDDPTSRKIYLVLEYCARGEIKWQKPNGGPVLSRSRAREVARDLVNGLEFLHANMIIHRDIKPANLLLDANNVVKISDFGVSIDLSALEPLNAGARACALELSKTVGTPAFFAPELCAPTEFDVNGLRKPQQISYKVDVWAFGVTLYCLAYGILPFQADNEYELFRVVYSAQVEYPESKCKDDELLIDLLRLLLTRDPILRPSIQEIKSHPFLVSGLSQQERQEYVQSKPLIVPRKPVDPLDPPTQERKTSELRRTLESTLNRSGGSQTTINSSHRHFKSRSASPEASQIDRPDGDGFKSKLKSSLTRLAEHMRPRSLSRSKSLQRNSKTPASSIRALSPASRTSSSKNRPILPWNPQGSSSYLHSDKASLNSDSVSYKSLKFVDSNDSLKMSEDSLNPARSYGSVDGRVMANKRFLTSTSSSSSSDGELMIVVGRNRSRSIGNE